MELKNSIFIFLILYGCSRTDQASSQKDINDAVASFTKKIFKFITEREDENFIISPYAIQRQLLLTLQAARGQTHDELQKAIDLDGIDDSIYLDALSKRPAEFTCNDHIYYTKHTKLRKPFLLITKLMFEITPEEIDFENSKESAQRINDAMEDATNGVIKKFVREKDIDSENSFCFLNSALFSGQFKMLFNKKNTRMARFYNWGKMETLVSALYSVQYFGYAVLNELKASMVSLPYRNSEEKLLIVLPNQHNGITSLLQKMEHIEFSLLLRRLRTMLVAVSLPQFNIDYRANLSHILTNFGVNELFTQNADLSNGFDSIPSSKIPCLFSKFHFDINEYGSAADEPDSRPNLRKENDYDAPEKFFLIEHPFLFFVHTNDTVHFFGRVIALNYHTNRDQSAEALSPSEQSQADSDEDEPIVASVSKDCGNKKCILDQKG